MKKRKALALLLSLAIFMTGIPFTCAYAEDSGTEKVADAEYSGTKTVTDLEGSGTESVTDPEGDGTENVTGSEGSGTESVTDSEGSGTETVTGSEGSGMETVTGSEGSGTETVTGSEGSGAETGTDSKESQKVVPIKTPQTRYSVSKDIKSFKLNASGGNAPLSYKSSNTSVASVSTKGTVKVKKNGTAYITISDGVTSKKVTVKVSSHKSASGYFVEAIGNINGRSGDSTGREIRVKWYPGYRRGDSSRSWGFIIRCNDPEIADKAALAARYIAKNNHFGYKSWKHTGQSTVDKRASIYKAVVNATGENPSKSELKRILSITKKADTSCTPTCLVGYWLYYSCMSDKLSLLWTPPYNKKAYKYYCGAVNVEYHQLEKAIKHVNSVYREKGMIEPFTIIYISSDERNSFFRRSHISKNLKRGDIICSCPNYRRGGHTGIMM